MLFAGTSEHAQRIYHEVARNDVSSEKEQKAAPAGRKSMQQAESTTRVALNNICHQEISIQTSRPTNSPEGHFLSTQQKNTDTEYAAATEAPCRHG